MQRLNQWLSLLANLAVLGGILFLGLEIRQNSDLMQIQIQQNRAESAMSFLAGEYNSPYIPGIRVKLENGEELTQEEGRRFREWFRAANRNQENILYQYNSGMLSENPSVLQFIEGVVASSSYAIKTWDDIRRGFTTEYVELVESVVVSNR